MRLVSIVIASLAALVTAVVAYRGFNTVGHLPETSGDTQFYVFSPALLIPLVFLALSVGFLGARQNGWALVMSVTAFAVAALSLLS
jgi:hypothetical protein